MYVGPGNNGKKRDEKTAGKLKDQIDKESV